MKKHPEAGLTLIEIILALSISAVLFAILLGALRMGHRSVDKGLSRSEVSQRMRVLSDRLGWLMRGAYPYVVENPEGKVLYFAGTPASVGFVTSSVDSYSDAPQDISGLKWVTLFVDNEGLKIGESLFFADVFESGPREEHLFDPTVTDLEFEYLDPGEEGDETNWVGSWNPEETEYLPSAVRITVTFLYDGQEVVMPPIVVAIRAGRVVKGKKPSS